MAWAKILKSSALTAMLSIGLTDCAAAQSAKGTFSIVVPRSTIYPGDRIVEGLLDVRTINADDSYATAVFIATEELDGQIARRTLLPGRAIPRDAVRSAPVVKQGQPVSVVFSSGSIQIQLNGTALQSGAVGDVISVRNADTGRVVRGRILADKSLEVISQ